MALANKYMDATKPYIVILRHRDSSIFIVTDVNHPDSGERDVISFFIIYPILVCLLIYLAPLQHGKSDSPGN
jgi:hypothetical protein